MIRRDPTEFGVIDASAHGHRVRPRRHQHRRRVRPAERPIHVAHQARGYLPRRSAYDAQSGRFTSPINATYQFNVVISAQGRQKVSHMEQSPLWSITQKPLSAFSKIACIGWNIFTNSL